MAAVIDRKKKIGSLIESVRKGKLTARAAIKHLVALREGTAVWFIPDQDKLNRAIAKYKEAFPGVGEPSFTNHGSGYAVTFVAPGGIGLGGMASLIASLGGSYQLPAETPGTETTPLSDPNSSAFKS